MGHRSLVMNGTQSTEDSFSAKEKKLLSECLITVSKINHGILNTLTRQLGYKYAKVLNKTISKSCEGNECVGIDYRRGFVKINSSLSLRTVEATSLSHVISFNKHKVDTFFLNLQAALQKRQHHNICVSTFQQLLKFC